MNITKFYAIGASEDGQEKAEQLGFSEIYRSPDGSRRGYMLETTNTASKLARYYLSGREIYSKAEREPAKIGDTGRQNSTNQKSPSRSRSRPAKMR